MVYPFDYFEHKRECARKQHERAEKLDNLPQNYKTPLDIAERTTLDKPIAALVSDVHSNTTQPIDILRTYAKAAIRSHEKTNCLTEILFPEAEEWIQDGEINLKGPLAGIPVSLKDTIGVRGFDVSVGYSRKLGKKCLKEGPLVRLLKEAGAVPFVKTNLPVTLLSFESFNDVWGRSRNPHNPRYSPGGSTGGESALLASGGSRIGVGSDVAGSVRAPAHFSGCYSLRCSTGRWPKGGVDTSMPGQEGIPSVFSPMARTLDDLTYFTREFIKMKPWRLDHTVHPIEWRSNIEEEYRDKEVLRIGVLRTDGVVDPSPACARALDIVASAMKAEGHTIVEVSPPKGEASPASGLILASQLLNNDGCQVFGSIFRTGESTDPGVGQLSSWMNLPSPLKYIYYLWVRYVRRDVLWAELLRGLEEKTAVQNWGLVARREAFRATWHEWWNEESGGGADEEKRQDPIDVMITPPNATPAWPHGGMKESISSCGYTFLFNLLDYTAGILPITHVNSEKDSVPSNFSLNSLPNGVAKGAYIHYDAKAMHGLPVGVQVVGRRLEEEKVLAVMNRIEGVLEGRGEKYVLLEVDVD